MSNKHCVICGDPVQPDDDDDPKHYHIHCAEKAKGIAVLWRGNALKAEDDQDLSWVCDKSDAESFYLGVSFEDEPCNYSACIEILGVEGEGSGANALEALDDAYENLKQECFLITGAVYTLGKESIRG